MSELPLLRFIPFRRKDILQMCLNEGLLAENTLKAGSVSQFRVAAELIEMHFKDDFYQSKLAMKDSYASLDPDADTRQINFDQQQSRSESLDMAGQLQRVLERANYDRVSTESLAEAMKSASLFHIRLVVNLDDFAEVLLYTRGASEREEVVSGPFNLWRKTVRFINYERVVLYLRFKDELDDKNLIEGCRPGSTMLKLFQNVPQADLEMLFPNTKVGMRLRDKLMIGVPALISGGVVLTTKLGATLVLTASLFGFWLGLHSEAVELDRKALLVLLAGAGTIGAFVWKQFSNFKNRKLRFTESLTRNLYFKLLDNNAGVIYRLLDDAEESEIKECLLAYYFLLQGSEPQTSVELDKRIEQWFAARWQCHLDFDIEDALNKLSNLQLVSCNNEYWQLTGPSQV
jgi:hypothetical protein